MPRHKAHSRKSLVLDAMNQFWVFGYEATSMNDLVAATGVSRHGIYDDFDGKRALFLAALTAYQDDVVSPAFTDVEKEGATLRDVRQYFDHQILRAQKMGLPGPGCLIANTMTELGPHDAAIATHVNNHNRRLQNGFRNALEHTATIDLGTTEINHLADFLTVNAQGLWSYSRSISIAAPLIQHAKTLVTLIETRICHAKPSID